MAGGSPPRPWIACANSWRTGRASESSPGLSVVARASRNPRRPTVPGARLPAPAPDPQRNFRFFDNRQKYLLFVNTCSGIGWIANRVSLELANIHPQPPAVRLFDAGMGDGTVLARVIRAAHDRFPTMPFYIVGKEISLEDIRLDPAEGRAYYFEHPATVLVLTNLAYADPLARGEIAGARAP